MVSTITTTTKKHSNDFEENFVNFFFGWQNKTAKKNNNNKNWIEIEKIYYIFTFRRKSIVFIFWAKILLKKMNFSFFSSSIHRCWFVWLNLVVWKIVSKRNENEFFLCVFSSWSALNKFFFHSTKIRSISTTETEKMMVFFANNQRKKNIHMNLCGTF